MVCRMASRIMGIPVLFIEGSIMYRYLTVCTKVRLPGVLQVLLGLLALLMVNTVFAETDAALQARIVFQAQHEPRLDGAAVKVVTAAGHVVLTGQVRLLSQKMLYEQIAWQTKGSIDVNSEIRVVPVASVSDQLVEERILAVIQKHKRFDDIDVGVKEGLASVRGSFENAADVLFLKWQIAEIEGVIRILFESRFIAHIEMHDTVPR